jgi:NAD(P)-dependent dehydrogenase (short-subunit alcohol dehydrogenase family)
MSNRIERVIITGAGSGIGFDLARRFLAEGARLVINGRDPDKLERARLDAVATAARKHMGGVDVLINNAGVFASKPFLETTVADLERFFETNVKGTWLMSHAIVPVMIEGGGGSIINLGTMLVHQAMTGVPVAAAMASKGGVHALTVSLAAELAKHQIRVNTLAPGVVRTPLVDDADALAGIHPLGRVAEVDDVSDAAIYLARAGFVTGTTLDVDGGYSHGR